MNPTRLQICSIAIAGLILSLGVRLIHYNQSLWCDEMSLALDLIHTPVRDIVATRAGDYTPNNHVLHTLLVKAILWVHHPANPAMWIRLPSLICGSLLPLAIAWPMRQTAAGLAIVALLLAALNPWLIVYSDEARGYALMTLLGTVSTHLLPYEKTRWPIAYPVVTAFMLYTVPVAGMLLIGHGITMLLLRRGLFLVWLRQTLIGGFLAVLLFLPLSNGIWFYIQHPQPAPDSFIDFANQLPRFALAGEYVPLVHHSVLELTFWMMPMVILVAGSFIAWRDSEMRFQLTTMAAATITFIVAALIIPGAGQIRFVPWCAIWLVFALATIIIKLQKRWGFVPATILLLLVSVGFVYQDFTLLPSQPIREAIQVADEMVPDGCSISVGFLAAKESVGLYGSLATRHAITATPGPMAFLNAEQQGLVATDHTPWLIMSYETMVHNTAPKFWDYIQANYQVKRRLPGRITPVTIYAPRH